MGCFLVFSWGVSVFAQQTHGAPVSSSYDQAVAALQNKLKTALSPTDKHSALVTLARYQKLGGRTDLAAKTWKEAAFAVPARCDYGALIEASQCAIATGEYAAAKTDLAAVPQADDLAPELRARAEYLSSLILLFENGVNPLEETLTRFAKVNKAEIKALATSYWLLYPGRAQVSIASNVMSGTPASPADAPPSAHALLQTGLFASRENAQRQVTTLASKGFAAQISERLVAGKAMFAVTVNAGIDAAHTTLALKDAGFEAFPAN